MPLPAGFAEQLAKARENEEYCDYEIRCEGTIIKVHKLILGIQSPVLNTACTGPFKENSTGIYEILDFPADVVSATVNYLYSGDYAVPAAITDETASTHEAAGPLLFHSKVFAFADKYLITSLQNLAKQKFVAAAHDMKDTVALLNAFPAVYGLPGNGVEKLRKDLGFELRHRMQTTPHSSDFTAALRIIALQSPGFLVFIIGLIWAEGARVRRGCDCGSFTTVDVSGWRCAKCKKSGVE